MHAALIAAATRAARFGDVGGGGGGGGYDLAAAIAALNTSMGTTVNLPIAPTNSGNGGTVTTMQQLTDATNTNGGVFEVQAGSYSGSITLDGQDQLFRFADGFQLAAGSGTVINVTGTAQRIHLDGLGADPSDAEFLGGMYLLFGPNDIKLKNLRIQPYNTTHATIDTVELIEGTRVLFERLDIYSQRYCAYNSDMVDFVTANCRMNGFTGNSVSPGSPQSIHRTIHGTRVVVMDNLLIHNDRHSVRVHAAGPAPGTPSDYIYVARNQMEGAGGNCGFMLDDSAEEGTDPQVNRIWYYDNAFYSGGMGNVDMTNGGTTIVSSGNTTPGGGTGPAWAHQ